MMTGDCYFGLPSEPEWFGEPETEDPENVAPPEPPRVVTAEPEESADCPF